MSQDVTETEPVPCSSSNSFFSFLLSSVETVNDGQFHSVELVMLNQTLNLVVDKGAPKSLGKLQKQSSVSLNTPLYIGGIVNCSGGFNVSSQKQIIFHPMERALTQPLQEQPTWHFRSLQKWLAPRCSWLKWKYQWENHKLSNGKKANQ